MSPFLSTDRDAGTARMLPLPPTLEPHEAGLPPPLLSPGSSAATVGTSSPPTAPLSPDKDRDREGLDDKVELLSKRCSKLASLFDGALFKTSVLGTRLAELELGAERCECGQRARKDTAAQETGRAAGTPDSQRRERAYDREIGRASCRERVS